MIQVGGRVRVLKGKHEGAEGVLVSAKSGGWFSIQTADGAKVTVRGKASVTAELWGMPPVDGAKRVPLGERSPNVPQPQTPPRDAKTEGPRHRKAPVPKAPAAKQPTVAKPAADARVSPAKAYAASGEAAGGEARGAAAPRVSEGIDDGAAATLAAEHRLAEDALHRELAEAELNRQRVDAQKAEAARVRKLREQAREIRLRAERADAERQDRERAEAKKRELDEMRRSAEAARRKDEEASLDAERKAAAQRASRRRAEQAEEAANQSSRDKADEQRDASEVPRADTAGDGERKAEAQRAAREEIAAALRARHDKAAAAHREQAEATSRDFRAKESTEGRGEYAQRVASARERQRRAAGTAAGASRPSSRQSFEGGRSHTFEDRWEAFDRLRRNREAADEAERASFAKATYEAKSKFEDSEAARQKADRGYYERARAWHTGKASGAPPAAPAWKAVATPTKRNAKLGDSRHYKTLGIQGAADTPEIKKSYRTLARRHHPDKHRSRQSIDTATEMFKSINSAYQALKDGTTRRKYQLEVLEGREK